MKIDMHFGAIKPIFENATFLRKNMTHEEKIVWGYLANNQLGHRFRRQHPIWMYIADFYCHELKLVIEIDGGIHDHIDVKQNDKAREKNLQDLGIKIIRFSNTEVRCEINNVLQKIKAIIQDMNKEKKDESSYSSQVPLQGDLGGRGGDGGNNPPRINNLFATKPSNILNIYCTAGYPQLNSTIEVMQALQKNGADMIELGMPYSDPLADGPVIQQSNMIALNNGMSIPVLFEQLRNMREHIHLPVILMGYMNPVMQYGVEEFCAAAQAAGVDGIILPDLPMHEFETIYKPIFEKHRLDFIFLVTPETSEERIKQIDALSSGFIYAVSSSSTTGSTPGRDPGKQSTWYKKLEDMNLKNPVLVGFGIKDKETFAAAAKSSNGAIIGTAYINALKNSSNIEQTTKEFLNGILG